MLRGSKNSENSWEQPCQLRYTKTRGYTRAIPYICPSSSCHSSFDMAGRSMPPPRCVFVSFSTHRRGVYPSSLHFCYFNAMRRAIPFSHSCFNTVRRDMPSSCLHFTSDRQRGGCPSSYNIYNIYVK